MDGFDPKKPRNHGSRQKTERIRGFCKSDGSRIGHENGPRISDFECFNVRIVDPKLARLANFFTVQ